MRLHKMMNEKFDWDKLCRRLLLLLADIEAERDKLTRLMEVWLPHNRDPYVPHLLDYVHQKLDRLNKIDVASIEKELQRIGRLHHKKDAVRDLLLDSGILSVIKDQSMFDNEHLTAHVACECKHESDKTEYWMKMDH